MVWEREGLLYRYTGQPLYSWAQYGCSFRSALFLLTPAFDNMKENSYLSGLLGGQCVLWIFLLACKTSGVGVLVFMT